MNKKQVKSKKRVNTYGEVFTNDREINAMLDLLKEKPYEINTTFLEPACGNGNFLINILERKLSTVFSKDKNNTVNTKINILIAIGSIYGIEIQKDNCEETKERLEQLISTMYYEATEQALSESMTSLIQYILNKNIIHGNGLSGLTVENNEPIVFIKWKFSKLPATLKG